MSLQRILTIFRKDVRDAIRDARVLMVILVPFGLGIFYNFTIDDEESNPEATIVWTGDQTSQLPQRLVDATRDVIEVTLEHVPDVDTVRQDVADESADIGFVIPEGFDGAIAAGEQPQVEVVLPESPSFGGDFIAASLAPVLRDIAGQVPPARLEIQTVAEDEPDDIFNQLGLRKYFVLAAATVLVAMIAMLAVPVVLADESDQRTLDALVMVASYTEVIIAKALFGLAYIAIAVPLLLGVTGTIPENVPLFVAGTVLFGLALIGFGLLLGGMFTASQLNTWGGLLLIVVLFPAFITGLPVPRPIEIASLLLPTSHATRISVNAVAGDALFGNMALSFVALILWAAAGFGLLSWRLSRREA